MSMITVHTTASIAVGTPMRQPKGIGKNIQRSAYKYNKTHTAENGCKGKNLIQKSIKRL